MRFSFPSLFSSANPYRDWFLILLFLLISAAGIAVLDAQLFLSATRPTSAETETAAAANFDKEELSRAVEMLQEKEKRFGGLKR